MARVFQTNIDLGKNQLLKARVENLASDPASPVLGQIYYNTANNQIMVYTGAAFIALSTGSVADATTSSKGIIELTNDLGGTATAPTVLATHLASALPPTQGGTGTIVAPSANGQILIGASGGTYAPALIGGQSGGITVTNGTNTLALSLAAANTIITSLAPTTSQLTLTSATPAAVNAIGIILNGTTTGSGATPTITGVSRAPTLVAGVTGATMHGETNGVTATLGTSLATTLLTNVNIAAITSTGTTATVTTATLLNLAAQGALTGATTTTMVAIDIGAMTGGATNNYGIRIAAPSGGATLNRAIDVASGAFFVSSTGAVGAASLGANATQQHTIPAVASDTIALLAAAQTFTNKTLTAPTLGGTVAGTYTLGGTPTLSGTFAGTPTFSGVVTFSSQPAVSGTSSATFQLNSQVQIKAASATEMQVVTSDGTTLASMRVQNLIVAGEVTEVAATYVTISDPILRVNDSITTNAGNSNAGLAVKRLKVDNTTRADVQSIFSETGRRWVQDIVDASANVVSNLTQAVVQIFTFSANGALTSQACAHNLNNQWPLVQVVDTTANNIVETDITYTDANNLTVTWATAPATNTYKIMIVG